MAAAEYDGKIPPTAEHSPDGNIPPPGTSPRREHPPGDDFGYATGADAARDRQPWRHRPDPLRSAEALYAGIRMCEAEVEAAPKLEDVIWALFVEAAQTERTILRAGPAGYVSAFPEVYYSAGEIFSLYVEMIADKIAYATSVRHRATAAALGRYLEVTAWLRYIGGRDRAQSKRVLWRLAQGAPAGLVARQEGYGTARGARAKKNRELANIADRLRREISAISAITG